MGSTEAKECADWTTRTERQNTSENILTMATVQMKNLRLKSNSARLAKVSAIRAPRPLARRNLGATVCRSAATDEIVEKLNGSLHSGSVRHCFIWINRFVGFLTVEELLKHGLHLWNTSRSTDKDDLVNVFLVDTTITHALFHGTHGVEEVVHVQPFKSTAPPAARI